jgi:hypothetical protein
MDDFLEGLFGGEFTIGRGSNSRRAQLIARMCFGILGAALCGAGAVYFMRREYDGNQALPVITAGMFAFFGCFWLFNVALGRAWRWPGVLSILSFVVLFATRVIAGP